MMTQNVPATGLTFNGDGVRAFAFDDQLVRTMAREDGPWFVLADVCRVLEHSNPAVAASRLDDDEKGVSNVYTLGGSQDFTIINESGLYSLILTSRKPAAKRFKKWVTSEVLPAIRKTGGYGAAEIDEKAVEALMSRAIAEVLPAMVAAQIASQTHALVRDRHTAGQILDGAKVPHIGRRGLVVKASVSLRDFCIRNGHIPDKAELGTTKAYVFPKELAERWMAAHGRRMIADHMAAASDQKQLRLVAPRPTRPVVQDALAQARSNNGRKVLITQIGGTEIACDAADFTTIIPGERYVVMSITSGDFSVLPASDLRRINRGPRAVMIPCASGLYPEGTDERMQAEIVGRVIRPSSRAGFAA